MKHLETSRRGAPRLAGVFAMCALVALATTNALAQLHGNAAAHGHQTSASVVDRTEIGGACVNVHEITDANGSWVLFHFGNHLHAKPVAGNARGTSLEVEGFIRDIEVVSRGSRQVALLATGDEGIVAVDVTQPMRMRVVAQAKVNYFMDGLTWTEGGGDIIADNVVEGLSGSISALLSDGVDLWIANDDFGIQRTALTNLLAPTGPVLEPDGTLWIDHEVFTLQYAGEIAWGGPRALTLHDGRLFAALGFLGMGIYDPMTLERVGHYNLYTDASVAEDWFIDMDVADEVQPGFLDPFTGMPDYNQASFEIIDVWHGGVEAPTPWADFDRYGKYYYNTNGVDVADFDDTSIAYLACGLGGLVAVDVSGHQGATPQAELLGSYLGYVPGVPAHGPDEPTMAGGGPGAQSLFPHFGAGMLKEAGAVDVHVIGADVYYTDHFAGLVALHGADDPAGTWHGPDAPYDNDDPDLGDGVLGDHWPDYEFVTSFDMAPYDPADHESLPAWMYEDPCAFCTGEIGGHGSDFAVLDGMNPHGPGTDLAVAVGGGGMDYVDVTDIDAPDPAQRWRVSQFFPTTPERGAMANGRPAQTISIGHTQGVAASNDYVYVADGPHGVSAWRVTDVHGLPARELRLVANTLQDEYPQVVDGTTVYPTPHAYGVVYDETTQTLYVLCQGLGMRRIDVSAVEAGLAVPGRPLLLAPQPTDIFEHNTESGSVEGLPKQDHAYDVVIEGGLAYVADGGNGITVYDLAKDPTDLESGFVVSNLGGAATGKAELGRSTGIALWHQQSGGPPQRYALMAAGPRGVGVVEISDPAAPSLVKVFEPIKLEDGKVGKADGRAVDVAVVGQHAWFSYDSFGVLCYDMADLIEPLPPGVDPTQIWKVQGGVVLYDYRPEAVARFRVKDVPGYEDVGGGAFNMQARTVGDTLLFQIAWSTAGVATLDWTDPAAPVLLGLGPTPGEAVDVVEHLGELFVADSSGGFVVLH